MPLKQIFQSLTFKTFFVVMNIFLCYLIDIGCNDPNWNHSAATFYKQLFKMNQKEVLLIITKHRTKISIIIRLLSLATSCTYFVPDEYWQSTEVAHRNVYGYGYLTWEWREKIRSYLHPFVFELFFRLVKLFGLDYTMILIYGPCIIQSFLSASADLAVYRLAWNMFRNNDVAAYAIVLHWFSWFVFYTSARTISNTAEMCLTVLGLSFFPLSAHGGKEMDPYRSNYLYLSLLFGGMACIIRCTSVIIWVPFVLLSLFSAVVTFKEIFSSTLKVLPVLIILSFGIDTYFYKKLTFVHWNFLTFNIFENIASSYGTHPFYWYLTQGIPVVLSLHLIYLVIGLHFTKDYLLFLIATLYVVIHSFIPHKEFRFLLPIIPIYICYAGYGMLRFYQINAKWFKRIFLLVFVSNIAMASYFSLVHQRGTISVMSHLRQLEVTKYNHSVLFLMPCHSTPFYSHLHTNIPLNLLTCEPDTKRHVDESKEFYQNPNRWLDHNIAQKEKPSHIILFNVLSEKINWKLNGLGYFKEKSFFHTHLPEGRIGSHVDVYKAKK